MDYTYKCKLKSCKLYLKKRTKKGKGLLAVYQQRLLKKTKLRLRVFGFV
jgi:hypothetical protein